MSNLDGDKSQRSNKGFSQNRYTPAASENYNLYEAKYQMITPPNQARVSAAPIKVMSVIGGILGFVSLVIHFATVGIYLSSFSFNWLYIFIVVISLAISIGGIISGLMVRRSPVTSGVTLIVGGVFGVALLGIVWGLTAMLFVIAGILALVNQNGLKAQI